MIGKLLLLATGLFTLTCSIGGVRTISRDQPNNAIQNQSVVLKYNLGIDYSDTHDLPYNNTFCELTFYVNRDVETYILFKNNDTYVFDTNDAWTSSLTFSINDYFNYQDVVSDFTLYFHCYYDYINDKDLIDISTNENQFGTITRKHSVSNTDFFLDRDFILYCYIPFDLLTLSLTNDLYQSGYTDGYELGREDGYSDGLSVGTERGYSSGYTDGTSEGYTSGYDVGYSDGYYQGYYVGNLDGTNSQINFIGLFGAIADTPVLIIRNLLGFDLFGTSALTIFMSLLTACIVIHFIRKFL